VLSALLCVLRVFCVISSPSARISARDFVPLPSQLQEIFSHRRPRRGSWIFSSDGQSYLDASGQAAVVNIGHGVREVAQAMPNKPRNSLSLTPRNSTLLPPKTRGAPARSCSAQFRQRRVYFTSAVPKPPRPPSSSRANSISNPNTKEVPRRFLAARVSRRTLGAMTVSGNVARERPINHFFGLGPHRALLLLSLSFQQILPDCKLVCAEIC